MKPLISLFWTSGVSKPEWAALFVLGEGVCVTHSLRFTSGATPADLLAASKQALVGLKTRIYCATAASQCETRQTLYWLSYDWFGKRCSSIFLGTFYLYWILQNSHILFLLAQNKTMPSDMETIVQMTCSALNVTTTAPTVIIIDAINQVDLFTSLILNLICFIILVCMYILYTIFWDTRIKGGCLSKNVLLCTNSFQTIFLFLLHSLTRKIMQSKWHGFQENWAQI